MHICVCLLYGSIYRKCMNIYIAYTYICTSIIKSFVTLYTEVNISRPFNVTVGSATKCFCCKKIIHKKNILLSMFIRLYTKQRLQNNNRRCNHLGANVGHTYTNINKNCGKRGKISYQKQVIFTVIFKLTSKTKLCRNIGKKCIQIK